MVCLWCCISGTSAAGELSQKVRDQIQGVLAKDEITVLITDSGLGGLSVAGDLEVKAAKAGLFKHLSIVFCNALPDAQHGYNNFETDEKKAQVFSEALKGMVVAYHPDIILIACNTLSVVYPATEFSKVTNIPVVGIVDLGVRMIAADMVQDSTVRTVLFGTETTIGSNAHAKLLAAGGIGEERIVTEACIDLAGEIQSDASSDAVKSMIEMYVQDAVEKLPKDSTQPLLAGLCCTHYGYCSTQFLDAFRAAGRANVRIVNPNEQMADIIVPSVGGRRVSSTPVSVVVASRAVISSDEIRSLSGLLQRSYPLTTAALLEYHHNINLFRFGQE